MTTLIRIIVTSILSLLMLSCVNINWSTGVKGNGNVVMETREVTESFSKIKATEGLRVYLTQDNKEAITVEADENLQELILTEIKDGVLKIHCKEQIGKASSKKINVNFKSITNLTSTSGSSVYGTNTIASENLVLKSSSGSSMRVKVNANDLTCDASSGSSLKVSGEAISLTAEASSGSNIKAGDLKAESSEVSASSGANLTVNTSKALIAKASSGGGVKYYGNPEMIDTDKSSGGSISKR
ncbi:head GIN domain-containing protein [Hyunsoonleella ulvae]|uniref:head GIN domain-containing protein n=1 Tax=Hyunsoonleella ulvae TaxID=2799948 RepID=UPI001939BC62|nr:head GIN domain-containing protein [Hyunsoonleella ulvae]